MGEVLKTVLDINFLDVAGEEALKELAKADRQTRAEDFAYMEREIFKAMVPQWRNSCFGTLGLLSS